MPEHRYALRRSDQLTAQLVRTPITIQPTRPHLPMALQGMRQTAQPVTLDDHHAFDTDSETPDREPAGPTAQINPRPPQEMTQRTAQPWTPPEPTGLRNEPAAPGGERGVTNGNPTPMPAGPNATPGTEVYTSALRNTQRQELPAQTPGSAQTNTMAENIPPTPRHRLLADPDGPHARPRLLCPLEVTPM